MASAHGRRAVLEPVVDSCHSRGLPIHFRAGTALAMPAVYEYLEHNAVLYAVGIEANAVPERNIALSLRRGVARSSKRPELHHASFSYQAKRWVRPRRVVAKAEWHAGELFPRVGIIVVNLNRRARNVVRFYNGRGTAEQWIRAGKHARKWTRLSRRRFIDNALRLQLSALTYSLASFLRRLALPRRVKHWPLTTLREKLINSAARIVRHARYVTFQMAEAAVPRTVFEQILARIARLAPRCETG